MDSDDLLEEGEWLTIRDISRIRGINRVSAWRWMRLLQAKYGEAIFRKNGRSRELRRDAFARAIADKRGPPDPRIVRRLEDLEQRLLESERRADIHAKALTNLHAI